MEDLDEVLSRDIDGRINWLVSKVHSIECKVAAIENNHLFHIEKDIQMIKRVGIIAISATVTVLTGINFI